MIRTILWELRLRRTSLLWWVIGSVVLIGIIMALFPSIRDQAKDMNEVISRLPAGLRELKAGTAGSVDVGDPLQFMNSQVFYATLPILWIIFVVTRFSSVLHKDELSGRLELLLSRPLSRTSLLGAKLASVLIETAIITICSAAAIIVLNPIVQLDISSAKLLIATLYTMAFCISFGLIAFMFRAMGGRWSSLAVPIAVLISFGGYLLASLSGLADWLKDFAKFAPYHHFNPLEILRGEITWKLIWYLLAVLVVTLVVSFVTFRRRDI